MPSTQSREEAILPLDPELNHTLRIMNIKNNLSYIDDEINPQFSPLVDAHNRVVIDYPDEDNLSRQPPAPRPQE